MTKNEKRITQGSLFVTVLAMNGNGGFPENFAPGALPLPSADNSHESSLQPEETICVPSSGSRNTTSNIDTKGTTGSLQKVRKTRNRVNQAETQRRYRERQRERAAKQGQAYEETARLFEQMSLENRQLKAEENALSQMVDYATEMLSLPSVSVGALREGWRLETDAMKDAILEAECRSWLHGERFSDEILGWEMRLTWPCALWHGTYDRPSCRNTAFFLELLRSQEFSSHSLSLLESIISIGATCSCRWSKCFLQSSGLSLSWRSGWNW
jgi:hypothetical protein